MVEEHSRMFQESLVKVKSQLKDSRSETSQLKLSLERDRAAMEQKVISLEGKLGVALKELCDCFSALDHAESSTVLASQLTSPLIRNRGMRTVPRPSHIQCFVNSASILQGC